MEILEEIQPMMMLRRSVILLLAAAGLCAAQTNGSLLLRKPSISRTQIVFSYAGDLWEWA